MSSETMHVRAPTSAAHDFYEVLFQGTDIVSSYWQPALKAVGRWQLEVSHLAARQLRANMMLANSLARAGTSSAMTQAYREYWDELSQSYSEANRNITSALSRTTAESSAILQMPQRRSRDTLQLIDGVEVQVPDAEGAYERKVA